MGDEKETMGSLVGQIAALLYMVAIAGFAFHLAWGVLHWSALPSSVWWLGAVVIARLIMALARTPDPMGDWHDGR